MSPKGFVAKLIAQRGQWVFLVQGDSDGGQPAFWYLMVDPAKINAFRKALEKPSMHLSEYGRILASGWGQEPSEEVVALLKATYGF